MTPQELKASILQLAIQGKLVKNYESDEVIDVESSFCGDTSDFFDIPENWKWMSIKDVASINTGLSFKKQDQKDLSTGSLRILRGGNIGDDYKYHLYEDDVYVDLEQFKTKYTQLLEGDVITPSVTSMEKICKTAFIDQNFSAVTAGGFVYIIRCLDKTVIEPKYLMYFIASAFNKEQCKPNIHKSGQAFYNLNKSGFIEQPICIPPFAEQKRIVAKIEELLPYVEEYDKLEKRIVELNDKFPDKLRKSILQQAVQGKLTERHPDDEPACELLRHIREEKVQLVAEKKGKADKSYNPITEDELPFELPKGWAATRIGELGFYRKGPFGSSLTKQMFVPKSSNSVKVYEQKNAIQKDCNLGEYYITREYFESKMKGFEVFPGDIIVSCAGTIGETYVMPTKCEQGIINQALMRIKIVEAMDLEYFLLYFDYVLKASAQKNSKGSAIKNIPPFEILKNMVMPLPPLAEQKRIVARVEELLTICDKLK